MQISKLPTPIKHTHQYAPPTHTSKHIPVLVNNNHQKGVTKNIEKMTVKIIVTPDVNIEELNIEGVKTEEDLKT